MLCERCREREAEERPTGYQGLLMCRGCEVEVELADARRLRRRIIERDEETR